MPFYLVRWEVEVDAASPEEAVDFATGMLPVVGNDTTATSFAVCPVSSEWSERDSPLMVNPTMIDLKERM